MVVANATRSGASEWAELVRNRGIVHVRGTFVTGLGGSRHYCVLNRAKCEVLVEFARDTPSASQGMV